MTDQKLYTPEEVRDIFKISSVTLYNWRRSGKINYVKYSRGCYRYYLPEGIEVKATMPHKSNDM